jgi:hypothetical protein
MDSKNGKIEKFDDSKIGIYLCIVKSIFESGFHDGYRQVEKKLKLSLNQRIYAVGYNAGLEFYKSQKEGYYNASN